MERTKSLPTLVFDTLVALKTNARRRCLGENGNLFRPILEVILLLDVDLVDRTVSLALLVADHRLVLYGIVVFHLARLAAGELSYLVWTAKLVQKAVERVGRKLLPTKKRGCISTSMNMVQKDLKKEART